ncbi:transglutaminase domain-containing protein [Candidatus Woesearchaeota archaeon]|nr:transglutaminase domain-containing protein [Candidatus Woesearchaeota archaeon]
MRIIKAKLVVLLIQLTILSLTILLILPLVSASKTPYESWSSVSDSLILDFNVSTLINVDFKSDSSLLKALNLTISFFPRNDYRQDNVVFKVTPNNYEKGNDLIFNWQNPKDKSYLVQINSKVKTVNFPKKVTGKIPFPITNIPDEYKLYLEETELMDYSDEAIIELASQLTEGKDDLYEVIFDLAVWTHHNINYSLETLTAEASLPASWVIRNRKGVCDELTNMFISLVRAIGVPAKFVAGISYTESELFPEKWGPHAWAEVYLPGYGWVPFDVTYGQFGVIDPTHIKLKESYDSDKTSTSFEWLGYETDVSSAGIKMSTEIADYGKKVPDRVKLTNTLLKDKVGFGSYNLLETNIKNMNNYYTPLQISISKTLELDGIEPLAVMGSTSQYILLKPLEEKNIFWKLKVSDKLTKMNIYTFPIITYTDLNESAGLNLASQDGEVVFSLQDIQTQLDFLAGNEEEAKIYSKKVDILCSPKQQGYYTDEEIIINCDLKNNGNTNIDSLNVCANDECKKIELKISQHREVSFIKKNIKEGQYELLVTAKNKDISKTSKVNFIVQERPKLRIDELSYPTEITFSEPVSLKFTVFKDTNSAPNNVSVKMFYNFGSEVWVIDKFLENREFVITIPPYQLASQTNGFKITVEYYDQNNIKYNLQKEFTITVKDLTLKEKIILYYNRINSDPKLAAIIAGAIVFLILVVVIGRMFGRKKR